MEELILLDCIGLGVGGHFANYSNFEYTNFDGKIVRQAYQGFGFDMTAGIEYMFSAPLSFSIDLKPYYEVQTLEIAPSILSILLLQ